MLPFKYRLKGKDNFEKVKTKGTLFQGHTLGLITFNRGDGLSPKVGFIVSTKVSKKAVERNSVKRVLRKVFKTKLSKIKPGYDILVLAKKSILTKDIESLSKEMENTFLKAGLIK
jgi:ribonuclease P protein component